MTSPKALLDARHLRARKTLGQNFLADPQTAQRIVLLSEIGPGDTVLEIGSGLGALTLPAAARAKRLFAVETDRSLVEILKTELSARGLVNVTFVEKDILEVNLSEVVEGAGGRLVVLGNLPYNISTPILVRLVAERKGISRAVLMLQKEVADRVAAPPGKKLRGRLSVLVQYCATVRPLLDVSARQFFPRPKVDSRVVEIVFRERSTLSPEAEKRLVDIVRAAFGKRRKTLKNALAQGGLGLDAKRASRVLHRAGIDPRRRAETLEVAEFVSLCHAVEAEPGAS